MAKKTVYTIDDYRSRVAGLKHDYLGDKMEYGWDYTITEEDHNDFQIFFIANQFKVTKLLFSQETELLIEKEFTMMDLRIVNKMSETLKAGLN